jgi:ribosomal protein S18 acetylase RimI-like enzyme
MSQINIVPINKPNIQSFVKIIYENFLDIAKRPELKHTPADIFRLLTSPRFVGYFAKSYNPQQNKYTVVGYLLAEVHKLDDGRRVLFISYLYVASPFRKHGTASQMMNTATSRAKQLKLDHIVLNCDTENKAVYNFYLKRKFMPDMELRTYSRYEVLSKPVY